MTDELHEICRISAKIYNFRQLDSDEINFMLDYLMEMQNPLQYKDPPGTFEGISDEVDG